MLAFITQIRFMKTYFTFLFILLLAIVQAQTNHLSLEKPVLSIQITDERISIDGNLEETVWQEQALAKDFWQHTPLDDVPAKKQTVTWITYNKQYLYIAAKCYDDGHRIIQTLKRDNRVGESDAFSVMLDPLNEQTNAFVFVVNAGGAQSEGLLALGAYDINWDSKWFSATKKFADHWTVEIAIPFKTLRYKEAVPSWGINFIRDDLRSNEVHTWARVPLQFDAFDLGYMGRMDWDVPPEKVKSNIALIPYVTGSIREDQQNGLEAKEEGDLGLDAKVAITSSLNLDIAINPDFSQVEVDQQVTNLTRFNVFFPERRTFFLENADIFASFGNFVALPFFSRRIGLDNLGQPIPILYGLRLSGSLNEKSRLGVMNIHTRGNEQQLGQNYTALSFHQKILKRSVIRGVFLNRQAVDGTEVMEEDYGRNAGMEFDFISNNGKVTAKGGYHHSFKKGYGQDNALINGEFFYTGRNFRTFTIGAKVGANYFADMGFVPNIVNYDAERDTLVRLGFTRIYNSTDYFIIPKKIDKINQHWFGLENNFFFNDGRGLTDLYTRLRYFIIYKNTSQLKFRLNNNYVNLLFPFSFTGATPLPVKEYNNLEFNIEYASDLRKLFNFTAFAVYGSFYEGTRFTYRLGLNFRRQPWGIFNLNVEQNLLNFPDPYGSATFTLIGSRIELSFTTTLFWSTFIQYNTQLNNFNINSRLQWRFAPMSDFYLVYTDNYLVEPNIGPKNRTLVAKLSYWLNW